MASDEDALSLRGQAGPLGQRPGPERRDHGDRLRRANRSSPTSGVSGRSGSGTRMASPRTGARRRSGRWGCSNPPTGRPSGSATTSPATRRSHAAPPIRPSWSFPLPPTCGPSSRPGSPSAAPRSTPPSLGIHDLHLNGQRVSDDYFNPGWTDYTRRVYYRAYDVTRPVHARANALGAILADGWYSGYVGFGKMRDHYGKHPRLKAQLHLEYADGTHRDLRHRAELEGHDGPDPRGRFPDGRDLRRPPGDSRLGQGRLR